MSRLSTEQIQAKLVALKEQEKKLLGEVKKAELKVAQEVGKLILANPAFLTATGLAKVAELAPAIKEQGKEKPTATATPTPASTQNSVGGN
jgi:ApbE superfamily uncharacterized protein (UPF0280 family)